MSDIYRKTDFRDSQAEAITNLLQGLDTVVLLPTGAGKSLIYQLSGLLLPGSTIVIDPIVALMEDQVEGLNNYGIDKCVSISAANKNLINDIKLISDGEFYSYYIAQKDFRLRNIVRLSQLRPGKFNKSCSIR